MFSLSRARTLCHKVFIEEGWSKSLERRGRWSSFFTIWILGHLHHKALKIMKQISTRLPKGTLEKRDTWKGCTLGTYTKASFHNKQSQVWAFFVWFHSYVCRPFSTTSTTKHMYYVIFVNDFTISVGFYSWKRNIRHSLNFVNLNHLLRKILEGKLNISEVTMMENMCQMSSRTYFL